MNYENRFKGSHRLTLNVIGAGGNGSHFLKAFASMHYMSTIFDSHDFDVNVFDFDIISPHNVGRQAFNESAVGYNKAVNICSRINKTYGFNYCAYPYAFPLEDINRYYNIYVLCIDSAEQRLDFWNALYRLNTGEKYAEKAVRDTNFIVIDMGNGDSFAQSYFLFHYDQLKEPIVKDYLKELDKLKHEPVTHSCSHAESVRTQGLFTNNFIALTSANTLWNFLQNKITEVPLVTYVDVNKNRMSAVYSTIA